MKKLLALIFSSLLLLVTAACSNSVSCSLDVDNDTVDEVIDLNWGIELSVEDVSDSGLTLICEQSGAEISGELQTGSPYWIELCKDKQWVSVEETPSEYERAWTAEAYIVPMDGSTRFVINWEWIYGKLPAGNYRIGKQFDVCYDAGNFDSQKLYAEFTIE